MVEMTVLYWMMLNPTRKGYYKECLINDVTLVGERHVMVYVELPQPVGGMWNELVPLDTMIEVENER